MIDSLPLSWMYAENSEIAKIEEINKLNVQWLFSAKLKSFENFNITLDQLNDNKKLIIRGCNYQQAKFLSLKGFKNLRVGKEAVIHLQKNNLLKKKSLVKLISRGKKQYSFEELINPTQFTKEIDDLFNRSKLAKTPKLRYLFQTNIHSFNRVFVARGKYNNFMALISLSQNSKNKFHIELMLRDIKARIGTMEALISYVANLLKNEGIRFLSLGEVPFLKNEKHTFKEIILNGFGRNLRFAYNFESLFLFKNKFSPQWNDIYLCANPKIGLNILLVLFISSNLHRLVFYKLKYFSD